MNSPYKQNYAKTFTFAENFSVFFSNAAKTKTLPEFVFDNSRRTVFGDKLDFK